MKWEQLLDPTRLGCESQPDQTDGIGRNEYQRDFDRIAFSHAFRRLQGKTQVFPFPDNDLIHNRLTHSVESSCVGRSLGAIVANELGQPVELIASIVSAACLAHDIGNPPFGHSGEAAISGFFEDGLGQELMRQLKKDERSDFTSFEGNAMALRILCHRKPTKSAVPGGERLTYTTLAAFVKYPRASRTHTYDQSRASQKKFGIFRSELHSFRKIAEKLDLCRSRRDDCWCRHPLAFLVEAADDICYKVADAEDGLKLNYVSRDELAPILREIAVIHFSDDEINRGLASIRDPVEQIGYLRAKAMNSLIHQLAKAFCERESEIMDARFDMPLLQVIPSLEALGKLSDLTAERIYTAPQVIQIEAAGYEVLPGLLEMFLKSVLRKGGTGWGEKMAQAIPPEYRDASSYSEIGVTHTYEQIMGVVEFISGMTDRYAVSLFRTLKGITLPGYY